MCVQLKGKGLRGKRVERRRAANMCNVPTVRYINDQSRVRNRPGTKTDTKTRWRMWEIKMVLLTWQKTGD